MKGTLNAFNKIVSHPVISAVVAAGIIGLGTNLLGWWPSIASSLRSAWQYALSPVSIPVWLLVFLSLCVGLALFLLAAMFWANKPQREKWRNYTSDEFYGIKWRWRYYEDGSLSELIPFCISCDFQLKPSHAGGYSSIDHWVYRCESCGHVGADIRESFREFENRVERQVHRKLRMANGPVMQIAPNKAVNSLACARWDARKVRARYLGVERLLRISSGLSYRTI